MKSVLGGLLLTGLMLVAVAPNAAAECFWRYDVESYGDWRMEIHRGHCESTWSNGSSGNSTTWVSVISPEGERIEVHADSYRHHDSYSWGSGSSYNDNYHHAVGAFTNLGPQSVRTDLNLWSHQSGSSDSNSAWTFCWGTTNLDAQAYPAGAVRQSFPPPVCSALVSLGMLPLVPYGQVADEVADLL